MASEAAARSSDAFVGSNALRALLASSRIESVLAWVALIVSGSELLVTAEKRHIVSRFLIRH